MSSHELVDVVNEDDQVIATVERCEMRKRHLPHRASYIAVIDGNGRFLVEVRTMNKDYAPGLFDACVGGVMQHAEVPLDAAKREMLEEIGLNADEENTKFYELGSYRINYQSGKGFLFAYLFLAKSDAITVRQKEEVSGIMLLTEDELKTLYPSCTYDSVLAFDEIVKRAKQRNLLRI